MAQRARAITIPTEHEEQCAFVAWFRLQFPKVAILAIPNGAHLAGSLRVRQAKMARMKAEGLLPGVPDLFIPAWRLWIEMKRQKASVVSPEQRDMIDYLSANGYRVAVARGFDEARRAVEDYRIKAAT